MTEPMIVGIDLGGTNMQVALVDGQDAILAREHRKTEATDGVDAVIARMVAGVKRCCAEAKASISDLAAVGVAAPGAIDLSDGSVVQAPNLQWENVPLRDRLRKELGCPVVVDNDVNVAAWGEHRLGAGRGHEHLIAVWVGTGLGGGLVLSGRLHHGSFLSGAEIGQTVLMPNGETGRRTVEDYCSRSGMVRTIMSELENHPESAFHSCTAGQGSPARQAIGAALVSVYESGDRLAAKVIHQAADLLGTAIANWVTVLAPSRVVIGGGVTEALGGPFIDRIRRSFERDVFPARCRECELIMTELAADAGLLGAATLARDRSSKV